MILIDINPLLALIANGLTCTLLCALTIYFRFFCYWDVTNWVIYDWH